jgi:RimJ/RimL family protein N-acetyltransferase
MRVDEGFSGIRTARLLLRRSAPGDAETISAYRSDPEVHRFQGWERTDVEGVRREIEEMAPRSPGEPGGWVQFTVETMPDAEVVGDVGLSPDETEPGVIKVGYTMSPAHQGNGYATEAVGALVDYALDVLGADLVRAFASVENVPSTRVAEKVGMTLMEAFTREYDGETWHGVRYERRRT